MSLGAEPTGVSTLQPPCAPAGVTPAARQVVVAVDACCDLSPQVAATLGVLVLPRRARIDGRAVTLSSEQTLHASCWAQPRRVACEPATLGPLAQVYERVLNDGVSILALHLPGQLDGTTHVALAARSILLAGRAGPQRVAVYEATAAGQGFAWLVQAAARAAAAGLALHQLLMLLDRIQPALQSVYLTGVRGPAAHIARAGRAPGVAPIGREQLWALDPANGLLGCQARGWQLAQELFQPGGALEGRQPLATHSAGAALLERIQAGRAQLNLPPLVAQPAGLSLRPLFPGGYVELTTLPPDDHVARIADVICRIDRPSRSPGGVRERGGIHGDANPAPGHRCAAPAGD